MALLADTRGRGAQTFSMKSQITAIDDAFGLSKSTKSEMRENYSYFGKTVGFYSAEVR